MSCPASLVQPQAVSPPSSPSPPSLCCSPYGMTVTVQGLSTEELKINGNPKLTFHYLYLLFLRNKTVVFLPSHHSQRRMDPLGVAGWTVWLHSGQARCRCCNRCSVHCVWHHSKGEDTVRKVHTAICAFILQSIELVWLVSHGQGHVSTATSTRFITSSCWCSLKSWVFFEGKEGHTWSGRSTNRRCKNLVFMSNFKTCWMKYLSI